MRRETFSKLPLADACPPSMVLAWTESSSAASTGGVVLHRLHRAMLTLGLEAALDTLPPEWREAVAEWDTSGLPSDPNAWAGEVAFALDVEAMTARELGRDLGRAYREAGALPHELIGAADDVALEGDDTVIVGDLKTGWAWVPGPRDNLQIRGLLAAAGLSYGRDEGVGIIWHRRLDNSGWTERARFDALDQADTLSHIRGLRQRVDAAAEDVASGRRPRFREGAWCATCPALPSCPAKKELLVELVRDQDDAIVQRFETQLNAEGGAVAYRRLGGIEALVKRLRKVLADYATEHPIDLGAGRIYGPVVSDRESLVGNVAFHAIRDLYGEAAAWAAADIKVTKTGEHSVESAVKYHVATAGPVMEPGKDGKPKKVPLTRLRERVLEEIRKREGVKVKPTMSVKEFSRRDEEATP